MADVTLWIAGYAAAISTYVAIRETVRDLHHRARRLRIEHSFYPVGGFSVVITNTGTVANTPTMVWLTVGRGRTKGVMGLNEETKLPKRLEPGDTVSQVCYEPVLKDKWLRHPTMDIFVEDAFGKKWYLERSTRRRFRKSGRSRVRAEKQKA